MVKELKKNRKLVISVLILGMYVLMLNAMTPYIADDFQYMYSFQNGDRITSLWQIFPSLYHHYMHEIGRIVPHFFAQLFLMGPKAIFNLFNTVFFLILVYVMLKSSEYRTNFSVIMWFLVPVLFWRFVPCFGQIFLWEDGSFNYLWSFTFGAVYLIPYLKLYLYGEQGWFKSNGKGKSGWKIALCIYAFFYGNYSENVSFSTIFISFIMLVLVMTEKRKIKEYLCFVYPVICGAIGYLFMLFSPGETSHIGSRGLSEVLKSMIDVCEKFYGTQQKLIVIWAVLMVISIYYKIPKKRVIVSVLMICISAINVLMVSLGSYLQERALAAGVVFLIWAIVVLLQSLRGISETKPSVTECAALCIGIYMIAGSLLSLWDGTYDIYETNRRNSAREAYILEQAASGVKELTVSQIEPATTYCAKYGLADIFTKEQDAIWLNKAIAEYYGLDMIYGESK